MTPSATSASSITQPWVPSNVLLTAPNSYWMSLTDTGNNEWIQFTFTVVAGLGRNGLNNVIQGSNDGTTWTTLYTFNFSQWSQGSEMTYKDVLTPAIAYKYVRYLSAASPYVLLDYLQFYGLD